MVIKELLWNVSVNSGLHTNKIFYNNIVTIYIHINIYRN